MKLAPASFAPDEVFQDNPVGRGHVRAVENAAEYLNGCIDLLRGAQWPLARVLALENVKAALAALEATPAVRINFAKVTGIDALRADLERTEADYRARGFYALPAVVEALGDRA